MYGRQVQHTQQASFTLVSIHEQRPVDRATQGDAQEDDDRGPTQ
jgi:hypothetical protein